MKNMKIKNLGFKLDGLDADGTFTGYLSVFDVEDSYGEVVRKGAFKKTLKEQERFPLLNHHDPEQLIGDFEGKEDKKGLWIKGRLILTVQKAKESYDLLRAGILKGLSIGFQTIKDLWDRDNEIRELLEVKLWEGSLVTFGANPEALIESVKSADMFDPVLMLIDTLKRKDELSDYEKELIYKSKNRFSALIGDWEPLRIGDIAPDVDTPDTDDESQDIKDNEPDESIIHSMSDLSEELKKLKQIIRRKN